MAEPGGRRLCMMLIHASSALYAHHMNGKLPSNQSNVMRLMSRNNTVTEHNPPAAALAPLGLRRCALYPHDTLRSCDLPYGPSPTKDIRLITTLNALALSNSPLRALVQAPPT